MKKLDDYIAKLNEQGGGLCAPISVSGQEAKEILNAAQDHIENIEHDLKLGNPYEPEDFQEIAKLMIKYLCENHNPHVSVIITTTHAELLEGIKSTGIINDFVLD